MGTGARLTFAFLLAASSPDSVYAADLYVSLSGDDQNTGLSEGAAWRSLDHAGKTAQAGDIVHVEAGDYGNDPLVVVNDGTEALPIVFEGYGKTPGDNPLTAWSYPDNAVLDASVMPLIDGGDSANGIGITTNGRSYVEVRNFQVQNFARGLYAWGTNHTVVDQVITQTLGDLNASYSGIGIAFGSEAYDNVVRNSIVYNAGAEGIAITGDRNLVEDCHVYQDNDSTASAAMDYYIVIGGDDNTVDNCSIERVGDLSHGGHGIGVKGDAKNNLFTRNKTTNLGTGYYVRHRGAQLNKFVGNRSLGDEAAILIRDGASANEFRNMWIQGALGAISFMDTDEDGGATWAGNDNLGLVTI